MEASYIEQLFGDIVAYIEQAKQTLQAGEWVDLKGLDEEVQRLCEGVAGLSREQAKEYAPELGFLHEQMQALQQVMSEKHAEVRAELKGTDALEKANKAYAQSSALTDDKRG